MESEQISRIKDNAAPKLTAYQISALVNYHIENERLGKSDFDATRSSSPASPYTTVY